MEKPKQHSNDGWRPCEVCGTPFNPTKEWAYKSAITRRPVCRYNCQLATERKKQSRYNNLISRDSRR